MEMEAGFLTGNAQITDANLQSSIQTTWTGQVETLL